MGAPNVYDTHYVNSGPGVGLSSSGRTSAKVANSSGSSYSSGHSGSNDYSIGKSAGLVDLAKVVSANAVQNPGAQYIRDALENPNTSAKGAFDYNDYLSNYGIGYDMDEYFDKVQEVTDANNRWSASQAQKQMDFQTMSNNTAMAWSAQEAQKSRDWTENLSNTAHQREVRDLAAAGLNPILAANNGAYSGSGATGQAFSSSGAMGQTDMSVGNVLGSLMSSVFNTAKDLKLAEMSVGSQKYMADMQYANAKLAAETSIYNNNNSVNAQKAISAMNRDADIRKASISADATRYAASTSAGAMMSAAATNAEAAKYSADKHLMSAVNSANASRYSTDKSYDLGMYRATHDIKSDPINWGINAGADFGSTLFDVFNGYKALLHP